MGYVSNKTIIVKSEKVFGLDRMTGRRRVKNTFNLAQRFDLPYN